MSHFFPGRTGSCCNDAVAIYTGEISAEFQAKPTEGFRDFHQYLHENAGKIPWSRQQP